MALAIFLWLHVCSLLLDSRDNSCQHCSSAVAAGHFCLLWQNVHHQKSTVVNNTVKSRVLLLKSRFEDDWSFRIQNIPRAVVLTLGNKAVLYCIEWNHICRFWVDGIEVYESFVFISRSSGPLRFSTNMAWHGLAHVTPSIWAPIRNCGKPLNTHRFNIELFMDN